MHTMKELKFVQDKLSMLFSDIMQQGKANLISEN